MYEDCIPVRHVVYSELHVKGVRSVAELASKAVGRAAAATSEGSGVRASHPLRVLVGGSRSWDRLSIETHIVSVA